MFGGSNDKKDPFHIAIETHRRQREQMMVLEAALPYLQREEELTKIEKVVDFFKDKILEHFKWEERYVFPVVSSLGDSEFKQLAEELRAEHVAMTKNFDVLVDIVVQHGFHFTEEQIKQRFVKTSKALIQAMLAHADKEDAELYPFIQENGIQLKGNPLKP